METPRVDSSQDAYLIVIGYSYTHPTLGEITLDPELLELSYLSSMVGQRSGDEHPLLHFDFVTAAFPRTRATGNKPYMIVQPALQPIECSTPKTGECPMLLTHPQAIRHARECASKILEEKQALIDQVFINFLADRLRLITEYFLWCDALVLEEWTIPILCSSLPFGFRNYYIWSRRADFDSQFNAVFGNQSYLQSEDKERLILELLSNIIQYIITTLAIAPYLTGETKPGIIDGVVFSHLCVLLATPISDHDGLRRILVEGTTGSMLESYCSSMNFVVQRGCGIWRNPDTFLIGLTPSEAPYPNYPNSARNIRDRQSNLRNTPEQQEEIETDSAASNSCRLLKLLSWPKDIVHSLVDRATRTAFVFGGSEIKKGSVHTEVFFAISASVLVGFLISGRSPFHFATK